MSLNAPGGIELIDVTKVFNAGKHNEFVAVEGIRSSIDVRQITVLKGPSGSGKTTLLTILGCMARPTSGRILLDGREITSLPERFLTGVRRNTFGFIFQQFHLVKGLTALENVMLPAYPAGENHGSLRKRAVRLLERFDLSRQASSKVEWLSGGEAQRVTIARALINDPSIVIADEPTAHLDSRLSVEFMDIMKHLRGEGKTVIIASHDPIVHEAECVETVLAMRDGKIVSSGKKP
jgi:putative ABC transport system ATP-binding protein